MTGSVSMTGSLSWEQSRPTTDGAATLNDQNKIRFEATGRPPRNEENSLETCARLVRWLNARGEGWSDPVVGTEPGVDGYSTNASGNELRMQVSRALHGDDMWRNLARAGAVDVSLDVATATREIMASVRKKADRYSSELRAGLVFLIDASRTPAYTFQPVLDRFRSILSEDCRAAGFAQVWVVGPTDELVARLDQ
jgi:hypothetical protein